MSPEQARGKPLDHRADLFSLGSVLYVLCTGQLPFPASTTPAVLKRVCDDAPRPIREVNPDVPGFLAAIILRLHAKNPDERIPSAAEVAELLSSHLPRYEGQRTKDKGQRTNKDKNRLRPSFVLGTSSFVLVLAVFAGCWFFLPPATDSGGAIPIADPLDGRKRQDIPAARLAAAGGGDPARTRRNWQRFSARAASSIAMPCKAWLTAPMGNAWPSARRTLTPNSSAIRDGR